jgi:hypothetical protein
MSREEARYAALRSFGGLTRLKNGAETQGETGYGSSRSAWYDDSDQHRAANRRAELVRKSRRHPSSDERANAGTNLATEVSAGHGSGM